MAQLFNTLAIMEILEDSGMEKKQSKAIVTAMEQVVDANTLATKSDINNLKDYVDAGFAKQISEFNHTITKQTIAFGSLMIVGVGLIGAIMKFL